MTGTTNVTVIGLCGVTCSGKTSLTGLFSNHYKNLYKPNHSPNPAEANSSTDCKVETGYRVETVLMDDYFLPEQDPRHILVPELNHINWELMTSLDIDKMVSDVTATIQRLKCSSKPALYLLEGFLLFNCPKLKSLCDLKFFIDLDYETCLSRRSKRVYDPPDVPGYFEKVVWTESQKNKDSVIESTPDLILLDGALPLDVNFDKIRAHVDRHLSERSDNEIK